MKSEPRNRDAVYRRSVKEMWWILALWLVCFVWVIGYCSWYGYQPPEESLESTASPRTVMGVPAWVCWGVFVPWLVATVVSCWFALTQIADDPFHDTSDSGGDDDE